MVFTKEERKAVDDALVYYIDDELLREKAVDDIEILLSKVRNQSETKEKWVR